MTTRTLKERAILMATAATTADKERNYDVAAYLYEEVDILLAAAEKESINDKSENEQTKLARADYHARKLKLQKFLAEQKLRESILPIINE